MPTKNTGLKPLTMDGVNPTDDAALRDAAHRVRRVIRKAYDDLDARPSFDHFAEKVLRKVDDALTPF